MYSKQRQNLTFDQSRRLESNAFTWCGTHTDETAGVAEAAPTVCLVCRGCVVVEGEVRLARRPLDAHRVAAEGLALVTLTQLGALRLILTVQLQQVTRFHFGCLQTGSCLYSFDTMIPKHHLLYFAQVTTH